MGLFSRTPKAPEPHVTRTMLTEHDVYRPGSHVAGILNLQCPTQRSVLRVEVIFYGVCTTHAWRSESTGTGDRKTTKTIHYHDEALLFRYIQPLGNDFVVRPGQDCSWRFDFDFPYETTNFRGEAYRKETACSPIYQVIPHPLPPSFAYDMGHSTYAHVEYGADAIFYFEDVEEPLTVKFEQLHLLPFPPQRPIRPSMIEQIRDAEKYASSRLVGKEKSLRHSIKDKFSSATPSLDLIMKASVLPVVTVGSTFSFFICTELSKFSDPYNINVPEVHLRVKSLKLTKFTTHRAIREDGRSYWPEIEQTHHESVPLNALPEVHLVKPQVGDQKQLIFPAAFEARIPSDTYPSFGTVNISYSCWLKAVVEVDVCGKSFEHKLEVQGLYVLPGQ